MCYRYIIILGAMRRNGRQHSFVFISGMPARIQRVCVGHRPPARRFLQHVPPGDDTGDPARCRRKRRSVPARHVRPGQ